MRILYYVFAIFCFAGSFAQAYTMVKERYNIEVSMICITVSLLGAGWVYLLAGIKKYKGEWATVFGVFSVVAAATWFGTTVDRYMNSPGYYGFVFDVCVVIIFIATGILLLASGAKLHRYTLRIEGLDKKDPAAEN